MCALANSIYIGVDNRAVLARYCPFCGRRLDTSKITDALVGTIDRVTACAIPGD